MVVVPQPRAPHPAPIPPTLPSSAEIVVVGAGVLGAATAWRLARRGHEVLVLDRFGPGRDRGASCGASRVYRPTYADERYVRLAVEAYSGWRELERETGAGLLTATGGVVHGDPVATAARAARLAAHGIRHEWLDPDEAAARWPGRVFEGRVLHQPDRSGRVHADQAVAALAAAAVGWGAVVRHRVVVEGLAVRGSDRVDVSTGAGTVRARRVVVAAGVRSGDLLPGSVASPPQRVVEERSVHVVRRAGVSAGPVFLHHTGGDWPSAVYGLPVSDGRVEVGFRGVGGARDPDAETSSADRRTADRLGDYVSAFLPGLDGASAETVECAYTSTPDAEPVLAAEGPVTVAAGFSGPGVTFAPAVGRVLADLAAGSAVGAR